METRTIFRIENQDTQSGMWYDINGVLQNKIHILCPYGISKDFPMPHNLTLHRKDGKVWYSGGKSIENMNMWFAPMDAVNLMNHGFKLFQMVVNQYQDLELEILFCREGVISQKEIPLEEIWDIASIVKNKGYKLF